MRKGKTQTSIVPTGLTAWRTEFDLGGSKFHRFGSSVKERHSSQSVLSRPYVASAGMSGDRNDDCVYLSTTLVPVLSLHSPHTQAPGIPAEATYHPSRL